MSITVRQISQESHSEFLNTTKAHVSFLQLPQWGTVKVGWKPESIGFFMDSRLVGVALVLYRPIPKLPQRSLAYIPEGPVIGDSDIDVSEWSQALISHVKSRGAFQVKMGPPVPLAQWNAETIKAAIATENASLLLSDLTPDRNFPDAQRLIHSLEQSGWTQEKADGAGFGDVQPRFVFQVPLAGKSEDEIFAGFNQLWRRNIRKAEKAGVSIRFGDRTDLPAFHEIYVETAKRDGFTPRGLVYFERMWEALGDHFTLHVAEYQDHVAAATIMITVGPHAWYSYGASTTADRDVRPSNALQWHMITAARTKGCATYDLRGISNTLDPGNHLFGLVTFKLGSGGFAQEYVGEWDFNIRKVWARAFRFYQSRG